MLSLNWTKKVRFSAVINGVFVGVGIAFLLWGATDIAFPITERMSVAVFGLTRIILGIISVGVGVGVEAVQWAKIDNEHSMISAESAYREMHVEKPLEKPAEMPIEKPVETTQSPTNP